MITTLKVFFIEINVITSLLYYLKGNMNYKYLIVIKYKYK